MKLIKKRQKITIATAFPVSPPRSGYATRIFHLYRHLTDQFDIEIISLDNPKSPILKEEVYPGLKEFRIPKSSQHQEAENLLQKEVGLPVTDIAMAEFYSLTPNYVDALRESTKEADLVIICHPYLLPVISRVSQKPFCYEALDLQSQLKRDIIDETGIRKEMVELTWELEKQCCEASQLVIAPSILMSREIMNEYDLNQEKVAVIQNGIESNQVSYKSYEERLLIKKKLGLEKCFIVLFTTEGYLFIDKTTRFVLRMASKLKNFIFLIVGQTGLSIQPRLVAPNIGLIEEVDESTNAVIQGVSDVAINPAQPGSYTDFKALSFLSAGIPLISTHYGLRNYTNIKNYLSDYNLVSGLWEFPEKIIKITKKIADKADKTENIKYYIESSLTWKLISYDFFKKIKEII